MRFRILLAVAFVEATIILNLETSTILDKAALNKFCSRLCKHVSACRHSGKGSSCKLKRPGSSDGTCHNLFQIYGVSTDKSFIYHTERAAQESPVGCVAAATFFLDSPHLVPTTRVSSRSTIIQSPTQSGEYNGISERSSRESTVYDTLDVIAQTDLPTASANEDILFPIATIDVPHFVTSTNVFSFTDITDAPIVTESTDAPIVTDNTDAPIVTDSTDVPIVMDSTDAPIVTYSTDAPIVTDSTDAPIVTDNTDAPIVMDNTDALIRASNGNASSAVETGDEHFDETSDADESSQSDEDDLTHPIDCTCEICTDWE